MSQSKVFRNKPEYWINMLEQVYDSWGRETKKIQKHLKDLQSIENTILVIEMKLRDMEVEGFEKQT